MPAECEFQIKGRACAVLAVGRCRECGRAFCDSHAAHASQFGPAGVLCVACLQAERARSVEKAQQSRANDFKRVLGFEDSTERLLVAYCYAYKSDAIGVGLRYDGEELLRTARPDLWALPDSARQERIREEVTQWFVARAKRRGIPTTLRPRPVMARDWLGREKQRFVDEQAWTLPLPDGAPITDKKHSAELVIFSDGSTRMDPLRPPAILAIARALGVG